MTQTPPDFNDPKYDRYDLRQLYQDSHRFADTDSERDSLHHTLGTRPTQAAPGNHTHSIFPHLTLVWNSGNNGFTHGSWKRIPWNGTVYVSGDWGFIVGPGAQIVVPETGTYDVMFNCLWQQDGYGGDRNIDFVVNGVGTFYSVTKASGTGNDYPTNTLSFRTTYNKGDVLYVQAYATTAAGLTTTMNITRPCQWSLTKVLLG